MKKLIIAITAAIFLQTLVIFAVTPERTKADQSEQENKNCQTQCDTKYKNIEGPVERHYYQNAYRETLNVNCKIECKKAHKKRMLDMGWDYRRSCNCIMHSETLEVYDGDKFFYFY